MKKILFLAVTFLLLSACKKNATEAGKSSVVAMPFFDLKGYFQKETTRLSNVKKVLKTSIVNGKREEKTLDSLDFQRELKIFFDSDINRSAWTDKFSIDSVFTPNGQLLRISYKALNENLKTRKIYVEFEKGQVSKIFIENRIPSVIATTRQTLIYQPQKGYSIASIQKVVFSVDNSFLVEVQFAD